ncbi:VanZ family protein [Halobacillus fulvus]|nr:VanZ family protein [Halobacillus fulvus]
MKKYVLLAFPVAIMAILFIFSSQPYHEQDLRPTMNAWFDLEPLRPLLEPVSIPYQGDRITLESHGVAGLIEFIIRKSAHFFIYFALMIAVFLTLKEWWRTKLIHLLTASFLFTIAYAASDEYHQSLTPNRTPYVGDVILDGVGALSAGLLIGLVYWRRKSVRQKEKNPKTKFSSTTFEN